MAWLVKNGYRYNEKPSNPEPLQSFIRVDGSIDVLVKMLTATHVVMQNEAVMALTIIAMATRSQHLNKMLMEANVAESLSDFIQRIAETERITNEIIDNLSALITVLKKSEELRDYLDRKGIDEKSIPRVQELATL
jgi:hypothetical protein